jgi:hypothetical protein
MNVDARSGSPGEWNGGSVLVAAAGRSGAFDHDGRIKGGRSTAEPEAVEGLALSWVVPTKVLRLSRLDNDEGENDNGDGRSRKGDGGLKGKTLVEGAKKGRMGMAELSLPN